MVRFISILLILSSAISADTIWHKSVLEGFAVAKKTNTPVLIDLYADWCNYCKVLEKEIFPSPEVVPILGKFITIRINGEEYPNLMSRYNVSGYPTILFLDKNGFYLSKLTGLPTKNMVIQKLQSVYSKRNVEEQLLERQKKMPGGTETNFQLAEYYYQATDLDKALIYYKNALQGSGGTAEMKHDSLYNLSLLYMDMEEYGKAVSEWTNYLEKYKAGGGDLFAAYYFRGIAYSTIGDRKKAVTDLKKASGLTDSPAKKNEIAGLVRKLSETD